MQVWQGPALDGGWPRTRDNRDSSDMTETETRLARAADGHGKAYCSVKSIMDTETIDSGAMRDHPELFQRSPSGARERNSRQ